MQFITIFALQRASQGQPQVVKARKHRNVLCDFLISFFPLSAFEAVSRGHWLLLAESSIASPVWRLPKLR